MSKSEMEEHIYQLECLSKHLYHKLYLTTMDVDNENPVDMDRLSKILFLVVSAKQKVFEGEDE